MTYLLRKELTLSIAALMVGSRERQINRSGEFSSAILTLYNDQTMHRIERLSEEQAKAILPHLAGLLQKTVDGGASVGFMPPLATEVAEAYWLEILQEVASGQRLLLVSTESKVVTGSVQLALCTKQNGLHRAEVQKLIVHPRFRQRGIARSLMNAVEAAAREAHRTLLVLDTEQGSFAESLYEKCGYTRAGVIPHYALTAAGSLISTVVFYRLLLSTGEP